MTDETESEEKRQFKGIWIPANIWLRTDINAAERVLYAEIECFTGAGRAYYRSNESTAAFLGVGLASAKRYIKHLRELGLIERHFDGRNRSLAALGQNLAEQTAQNEPVEAQNEPVEAQNEPHRIQTDNSIENNKDIVDLPAATTELYNMMKAAFESKHGQFDNYGKEGKAIKGLIAKAEKRFPGNPGPFIKQAMETFWHLKQNGKEFWREQPFLPSRLNASGIWPSVLEKMRDPPEVDPEVAAVIKGAFKR